MIFPGAVARASKANVAVAYVGVTLPPFVPEQPKPAIANPPGMVCTIVIGVDAEASVWVGPTTLAPGVTVVIV